MSTDAACSLWRAGRVNTSTHPAALTLQPTGILTLVSGQASSVNPVATNYAVSVAATKASLRLSICTNALASTGNCHHYCSQHDHAGYPESHASFLDLA